MKAKTSPIKSSSKSFDPIIATRSIVGLLIVMLAGSVFFLFRQYEETIILNNMFYPFMILTFIGMALLVSLLFLVNPSHPKKK
jgi:hypothetical protein